METTAHIDFIAASYASAVIIIGALIAWVSLDYRAQRRKLADLELQGFTRGSGTARTDRTSDHAKEAAKEQA
ncbi:MAG TPA: heme exporter protein CcmD [Xanthobacteraceae bacterium]|jgi:heme exporter protein CcmD|nr:heme exporter protein CcmD [Xanthobacteraceae bacterium]